MKPSNPDPSAATAESDSRTSLPRAAAGAAALTALPAAVLLGTASAMARGWPLEAAGPLRGLIYLSTAWIGVIALALVTSPLRRFIAYRAGQFALLATSIAASLIASDWALRALSIEPPFHRRTANTRYRFEPDPIALPGVSGSAEYTTNSWGLRGPEVPPRAEAYRILCVGGGTTDCPYLDDKEAWPALAAQDLPVLDGRRVWAGTAAISEYSTGHHLRFLANDPLLDEVDCVVVLAGANDLMRTLLGLDSGEIAPPFWMRSAMVSLARRLWNAGGGQGMRMDPTGAELKTARLGPGQRIDARPRSHSLAAREIDWPAAIIDYQERLQRLIAVSRQRRVRLIFITQPALWHPFLSPQAQRRLLIARVIPYPRPWSELTAERLSQHLQQFNDAMRAAARENDVEVVDAASRMDGREAYFYDDFHLSEKGNEVLAKLLADYLRSHPTKTP